MSRYQNVFRYCRQGVPQWKIEEVDERSVEPTLLKNIKELLKKLPYIASSPRTKSTDQPPVNCSLYRCRLILPRNSPLTQEMIGEVMPSKRMAKRAVALKACIHLHELKELDDIHLLPVLRKRTFWALSQYSSFFFLVTINFFLCFMKKRFCNRVSIL